MKIIIFGLGNYYKKRRKDLETCSDIDIVAYTDNNSVLWGKSIGGIQIIPPDSIEEIVFDRIVIMSVSIYAQEIFEQLSKSGIEKAKIQFGPQFCAEMVYQGKRKIYQRTSLLQKAGKNILIIASNLNYNGGTLAAVYAAMAIQHRGYYVVLAVPESDERFLDEVVEKGIVVAVCPALPYIYDKEWVKQFDIVIVNVLPMMQSAYDSCMLCPTLWWIHESIATYESEMAKPWNKIKKELLSAISIYGVSNIAKRNFNTLFSNQIQKILCFGIPDCYDSLKNELITRNRTVFAIIGYISETKAQNVFVEAAQRVDYEGQAEFWIIGDCPDNNAFSKKIQEMVSNIPYIKMLGVLTREEIYEVFPQIDVVICASREETMSITIIEGMMFGKACITTENTGIADYIQNGENGFIVPVEDVTALQKKIEWMIENREKMYDMGKKARKTYEQYFTMDVFGERLEKAILETKRLWDGDTVIGIPAHFKTGYEKDRTGGEF